MGDLKPGWKRVKFGDVVRLVSDRCDPVTSGIERFVGLEHIEPGDLRIRSWGDVADGTTFTNRFRPGQVLFGKRRAYQRKVAVADFEGVCSGDIYVLASADPGLLLPELLPFLCQTDALFEHAVGTSAGSLSPRTNWTSLAGYEFMLPPLEEQSRACRVLRASEEAIQNTNEAMFHLSSMGRRLMQAFGIEAMPSVPVGTLLTEAVIRGVSPSCNAAGLGRATLPAGCIYSGIVDVKNNLKYAEIDDKTFEKYRLRKNDVLVLRGNGNRELVGRAGLVAESEPSCFFPDLLVRLRFDASRLLPAVASLLLNCVPIHAGLALRAKSSNGIFKIGFQDIREHRLPLPSLEQQRVMLEAADAWSAALSGLAQRLRECEAIKGRLLNEISE
jgi:type I restriction enzyme S subunit